MSVAASPKQEWAAAWPQPIIGMLGVVVGSTFTYLPDGRSLAVVEEHAEVVRMIFRRYLEIGNVWRLKEQLERDNIRVPRRITSGGKAIGGGLFQRGQLYFLLKNPLYVGEIRHKEQRFVGLHPAIIAREFFDAVQAKLAENLQGSQTRERAAHVSLLAGKLFDEAGHPLVATHASKGPVRYRYYSSRRLPQDTPKRSYHLSAAAVEKPVAQRIADLLERPIELLSAADFDVVDLDHFHDRCRSLVALSPHARLRQFLELVDRVEVSGTGFRIWCNRDRLGERLDAQPASDTGETFIITLAGDLKQRRGLRLVTKDGLMLAALPETAAVRLIVLAHRWWGELRKGELSVSEFATRERLNAAYVSRVVRLAFLSPAVVKAALDGQLRAGIDGAYLKNAGDVLASWSDQERLMLPRTA